MFPRHIGKADSVVYANLPLWEGDWQNWCTRCEGVVIQAFSQKGNELMVMMVRWGVGAPPNLI